MFCAACGAENADNNYRCSSCDAVLVRTVDGDPDDGVAPPPDRLALAIVVTLLCCWPFGIPAIVYAARTMSANSARDIAGAREFSTKATTWCWISFGVGAAFWGCYAAFFGLMLLLPIAAAAGGAGGGTP
jgi:hypothetical protein